MKSPREYQGEIDRLGANRGAGAGNPRAGVSEAGVLPLPVAGTGDCRREANKLLIELLTVKTVDRNNLLRNVQIGLSIIHSAKRACALQWEIDALLWMMTCCGLVEIDEEARRIAACPKHLCNTLSEVLGTR